MVALFVVLLLSFLAFASVQRAYSSGDSQESNSYTIWREGDNYNARNDWNQSIDYSDSNFTHVFDEVLNAFPSSGGVVHLRQGFYEGWMVIDRSGVVVKGEGASSYVPLGLPDDPPTELTGTVLKVVDAGRDGIHFVGQLNGVHISDSARARARYLDLSLAASIRARY